VRSAAVVFCGVILSGLAFSQQTKQPSATLANDVTASRITVRGCIQGGKTNHFSLLQASTGASFELQGNANDFQRSNGQLVEVQASELAPTARNGLQSHPRLEVSKLHVIARECPIQGYGKKPPISQSEGQRTQTSPATRRYQPSGAPDQTPPPDGVNPNGAGASGAPSPGTGNPPPN
jgi:hypothetical protein